MHNPMAHRATERILTFEETDVLRSALEVYHGHCLKQMSRMRALGDRDLASVAAQRFATRADATKSLSTSFEHGPRVVLRW